MKNLINASRSQSLGIFSNTLYIYVLGKKLCKVFIEKAAVFSDTALFHCNFTITNKNMETILLRSLFAYLLQSRNKGSGAINLDISCLISISLYKRNNIVEK